jgi:hypothetical protein
MQKEHYYKVQYASKSMECAGASGVLVNDSIIYPDLLGQKGSNN